MGGATRTLFPFAKPSIRTDDIGTARFPKDKSDRGELIEEGGGREHNERAGRALLHN